MSLLNNTPLPKERSFTAFSTADDADNVFIPCTLSLLAHELYPNFLAILKSTTCIPTQLHTIETLQHLHAVNPTFLTSMKRLEDEILPLLLKLSVGDDSPMIEKVKKASVLLVEEAIA